jgi:hypothetical protein
VLPVERDAQAVVAYLRSVAPAMIVQPQLHLAMAAPADVAASAA